MLTLYHAAQSRSIRPRWVLEELGAPYRVVRLDLAAKEHKKPEYLRVNPNGTVPTLVDHDVPIFESAAICQHLADRAYLVDDFSVADVMVGSTLRWGGMMGLLDGSRPGLATYVERLTARPALQRATAD